MIGGFSMQHSQPEVDQINFASRVTVPVLMLSGRYDFFFPVDASQKPMFDTFGTPGKLRAVPGAICGGFNCGG